MKIGILNMQYSRHNYGALLQAAALEHMVRKLLPEANVEHIDARPIGMKEPPFFRTVGVCVKRYLRGILRKCPNKPQVGNYHVFSDFRQERLQLTEKTYFNYSDFERENWNYDIVLVGSDQVFRVKFVKNRSGIFFLRFLPDSCKRIAYAASFGVDHWEGADDPEFTSLIGKDLAKFDAISVRESRGVEICRNTFGLEAKHVLDPTLLIGRAYFDAIIEDAAVQVAAPDWSMHCISEDAPFISDVPSLALKYNKSLKDVYYKRAQSWPFPSRTIFSSVPEWLAYIRDTKELVLTDSFHAVCFCLLFEKDFLVFTSKDKGQGRMTSLLGMLGLEHRICSSQDVLLNAINGIAPINYYTVRDRLEAERARSASFLKNVLLPVSK
jgi:hypothetical protein